MRTRVISGAQATDVRRSCRSAGNTLRLEYSSTRDPGELVTVRVQQVRVVVPRIGATTRVGSVSGECIGVISAYRAAESVPVRGVRLRPDNPRAVGEANQLANCGLTQAYDRPVIRVVADRSWNLRLRSGRCEGCLLPWDRPHP
jgi:hypothetical protein